jgi:hypothetical protein
MSDEMSERSEVPEQWLTMNLEDMVDKGWRPRIKRKGKNQYLTIRFGNQERSLGPATEERMELFGKMFPELKAMLTNRRLRAPHGSKLMSTKIRKPQELGTSYRPSLEVLNWYSWAKSKAYDGSLGDFVNEVVHNYFKQQGWKLAVMQVRS